MTPMLLHTASTGIATNTNISAGWRGGRQIRGRIADSLNTLVDDRVNEICYAVLDASSPRTHHPHCRVDGDVVDIDIVSPTHGRRVAPTLRALCLRDSRGFNFVSLAVSATVRVPVTPEMRARARDEEDDGAAGGRAWGQRAAPPFSPDWGGGGRWRGRRLRIGAARSAATRFGDLPFVRSEAFSSKARPETAHGGGAQRHCSFVCFRSLGSRRRQFLIVPVGVVTIMRTLFDLASTPSSSCGLPRPLQHQCAESFREMKIQSASGEQGYPNSLETMHTHALGDEYMYRRPANDTLDAFDLAGMCPPSSQPHSQRRPDVHRGADDALYVVTTPPHLELRPSISDRETPRSFISDAPRLPAAPGAERRSNVSPSDEQALRRARLSLDGDLPMSYMATVQQLSRRCSGVLTMLGAYSEL
ncbi:hypothetical protein BD626DRAFT_539221 [Schizophyllum amplum]|uniref:Uncharacterized protein n=1 Tax=Schizophyllum amplum TaxID=97359 RepID=A0A550C4Y5_9AGAR|nr:hypothetical protein BD626DRAFT_539221 [Auriculariopsis ampla]